MFKSGFVALAGKPNVGKSTLINAIMAKKVTIVSEKPQTTRNRINCIYTTDNFQIVFVDAPGIHKPFHKLGEYMVKVAIRALNGIDLVMMVVDASRSLSKADEYVAKYVLESKTPAILVINKIDLMEDKSVLTLIEEKMKKLCPSIKKSVAVSALTGENLDKLIDSVVELLPEGPKFYPDDMITDRPISFIAAEIIREKILHLTREEIPHSVAVLIEDVKERNNDVLYIRANIIVERDSQKGIVIGKDGKMIKQIGTMAREEVEFFTGRKIFLDLHVKVRKNWRNDDFSLLNIIGFKNEIKE